MAKYKYPKPFILPKFFGIMISHPEMYLCHSCFFFLPLSITRQLVLWRREVLSSPLSVVFVALIISPCMF